MSISVDMPVDMTVLPAPSEIRDAAGSLQRPGHDTHIIDREHGVVAQLRRMALLGRYVWTSSPLWGGPI